MKNVKLFALLMVLAGTTVTFAVDKDEVWSVRRDIDILERKLKDEKLSHHDVESLAYRIECYIRDLKKDNREMTTEESSLLQEALEKLVKAFKALPESQKNASLVERVEKLKAHMSVKAAQPCDEVVVAVVEVDDFQA